MTWQFFTGTRKITPSYRPVNPRTQSTQGISSSKISDPLKTRLFASHNLKALTTMSWNVRILQKYKNHYLSLFFRNTQSLSLEWMSKNTQFIAHNMYYAQSLNHLTANNILERDGKDTTNIQRLDTKVHQQPPDEELLRPHNRSIRKSSQTFRTV